jgi:peptidyl-prolyl cis-trans isomerase SurA
LHLFSKLSRCFLQGLFCLLCCQALAQAKPVLVDRVVAVIEEDMITLQELEAKAAPFMAAAQSLADPQARARKRLQILRQVLDIEIGEKMVSREISANKEKLAVGDKDIDRAVQEVAQANHVNTEQLQAALYGQGMTWLEYRGKLREQLERTRLIQYKVQGKVQIKDADVRRRCLERQRSSVADRQVCAAHVLLKITPEMDEKAQQRLLQRATQLQAELSTGADFAAYALKYSEDTNSPDGSLGCFAHGEMLEPIDKAAFALKVGEVSTVVRSPLGLHIVKVLDSRSIGTEGCDKPEAQESFRAELYQEEMQRQMATWVEELRKKAFVEVRLDDRD